MSAQPIVSFLDGAAVSAPIGGERTITVRFDNIPDAGPLSNVGYSPYINLILPTNGSDGAGAGNAPVNDGLAYLGATYLGVTLQQWVLEFPTSGQVTHPFTTDALGNPVIVTGTPGETLVVLRLPFGSFTPGQTAADVQVKLDVSDFADLGQPLAVKASGGFAYGRDPLLNPTADAPVFGASSTLTITPTVIELDKVYVGPEQETATGPSYAREWLVKALIADGQTVTGLKLTDTMPDGTFIKSVSIVNGTGTTSYSNVTGEVTANFTGSYTGGVGGEPTLKIEFYVPEFLRDGVTPVLNPLTGDFRVLENNARLDATWDPTDGRDPVEVFAIDPAGPEDIITAKSIAVQKSVAAVTTLQAGENLQWTLDGQVSNYFNMDDLELIDTLGDGQVFDTSVPVTITMKEGGATLFSGTISPFNISVTRDPLTGISTIRFDVSKEMRDRGIDDMLNGRPGGVENQATVLVKFQSTIEQSYISTNPPPSNEPLVDQGDPLVNDVDFGGVVDETNRPKSDDSGAGVTLPVSDVGKSIYAINGNTAFTPGPVSAGDAITFRLTLDMPLTGAHDVALSDFLPLPVLKAIVGMTFTDTVSAATPGANQAKWGPGATFDTSGDPSTNPTITFDALSNSLKFDFGDAVAPGNPSSRIDLLFTVVVQDEEFGDGLLLTNQVTSTETNSFGAVSEDNAIVQFVLGEPELNITKGVIADTNANANLTTSAGPSGITFNAPGTAGNRFTGTISSNALDTRLIDANLTGADAGDRVSFAIMVENTGSSLKGAFDVLIRDTMPAGFEIPAGGLNLRVTDGAGNVLPFTVEGTSIFDPAGGIRLGDAMNSGSIGTFSATSGDNIVVITYDLELVDNVAAFGADLVNTATIEHFAAMESGIDRTDYTPAGDLTDTAFVRTQTPTPAKVVKTTSEAHTGTLAGNDSLTDLTIGETVTYTITVTVPEGAMTDFRIEDWLPTSNANGGGVMEMLAARFIGVNGLGGASVFDTTPVITLIDSDLINGNDRARFDFGDVLNTANTTGTQTATVTLEIDARVKDNALNVRGDKLTNTVIVSADDPDTTTGRSETRATVDVEVVAPNLDIDKTANKTTGDAFDTISYTITVENKGVPAAGSGTGDFTARAWDVSIKDLLADVLLDAAFQPATLVIKINGALVPARITTNGSPVDYTIDFLDPGEKVTITFDVIVDGDADAGETLINTANTDGSSMDGTGNPDDRNNTDSDGHTVTIDKPTITKAIVATTDGNTGSSRHGIDRVDVRIGEEITYEIKVRLPEGDSTNLRLTDLLEDLTDAGNGTLTYVANSLEVVSVGAGLKTFTGGVVPVPTLTTSSPGSTTGLDQFVLNFGDVRNTVVNADTDAEVITLRIKAVVNDVTQNNDADRLTNTGSFNTGGPPATNGSSAVEIDVVEPDLAIDKSSAIVGGQALDAGALVNYSITIQHKSTSDAPAYDLVLTDLIPAGMELVAGTLTANAGSVSSSGNAISWSTSEFVLGGPTVTITYQARLLDGVTPAQVLSNTARLTYDTNPADPVDPLNPTVAEDLASRSYNTQDTETRTVALAPTIDKSVIATGDTNTGSGFVNSGNPDAAPGETVTYRLTVTVGEGTQRLVVSDSLPTGLIFESASVESVGATITGSALSAGSAATSVSGGAYSFDFGTIVNAGDNDRDAGDTVTILVTGRVATTATAGATLTNTATTETYAPGGGKPGLATATDDAKIDVVRPDLVIVKDAAPGNAGDAGNLVTYTVTLSHAAGSTSPAYLVNLSDILPAGVTLLAGSATASVGIITESGGNIGYTLNQYLLGAAPVTITYQARLNANIVDGQSITNTAQVNYSSAPVLGVSVTESDPATVTTDIVNTVVKTLESTSLLGTIGSAVGIGEEITFLVTATLGEGSQRIVLRDVLPTGLDFVDSELVSLGGITGSALSIGADGVYNAGTRTLSFNLGDISNPFNNTSNAADQVVFRVVAKVADISGNAAGAVLTNVGAVDASAPVNPYAVTPGSSPTTVTENEVVTVVRASLGGIAFRDVDGDGVREAGDTVLAGIPVTLLNADGTPTGFTAVTAADGSYLFDDLIPGSYRVRFDEVGGNERTLTDQGPDTTDSDANQGSGITGIYTLTNGQNVRNVDAGFFQLGRIGDRVWEDTNGDGLQNDGATGLVGVTVRLLDGLGNEVTTTVTGADGFYEFTGLNPGDYSISVAPAGYIATARNAGANANEAMDSDVNAVGRSDTFNLESGENEPRVDAGFYRGAKLGGTLFVDVNGDGLQGGPGEGGVSGRLVQLLDSLGNATGRTAFTDASGNYLFDTLAPGTYSVRFVPDAATPFTMPNVGLDDTIDSDANVTNGRTANVTIASGGDDRTLDAGIYVPAAIGDLVFEDVDGDGQRGLGEAGIAGATVKLLDALGNTLRTTISGAGGEYSFTGLAPADYRVEITKAGHVPTQQNQGADVSDSDIGSDGRTATVNLISGETDNTVDGGLYRPAAIGNRVWLDADNNGVQDAGENGVAGVTVRLLKADGTATGLTDVTDSNGIYGFDNLAPGDYRVEFVAPADKAFAKLDQGADGADSDADRTTGRTDIVTLSSGETDNTLDAGLVELGDLTGRVWLDQDGDGTQEPGEGGITGITVRLLNADGSPTGRTTITGSHGTYLFEDVVAGDYRVEFVPGSGIGITLRDQGTNELIDSDADPTSGITGLVTVRPAETTRYVDAGIYLPASLGDRVWQDTNGDGLQNDGATGIVGATVTLYNATGGVVTSTITGADGFYQFTDLIPGDYTIGVLPPGFTATPQNTGANANEATDSDVNALGRSDTFNLESGETEARLDAGFYRGARLGGTLFEDVNGDGLQGGLGEAGISGRVVTLLDVTGNSTGRTAITDGNGNYLFEGLQPGTYSVQFTPSAAQPFTKPNEGLNNGIDSDANVTTGKTEQVTLVSGGDDRTLDAGVYTPATIGNFVWEDINGNGIQDGGEPGIAGVTVQLHSGGTGVTSTVTDADGFYQFTGVRPGYYSLIINDPVYKPTLPNQGGDDTKDSDFIPSPSPLGWTGSYQIISGQNETSIDAGLYRPAAIGNRVWLDADNDGIQDLGEAGIAGVTVRLLNADGTATGLTDITDVDGIYGFDNLAPGDYRVEFAAQPNRVFAKLDQGSDGADSDADRTTGRTGVVTLSSGETDNSVDAGFVELGDLTGRVWVDRDGDGLEEGGELSQAGITVRLLNADGIFTGRTEVTQADGTYLFQNLQEASYRVEFVIPPGLRLTLRDQGLNNTIDSDPNTGTGITDPVFVPLATLTRDVDAGVYVPASIGDRVWHDLDADGVQDGNEPGLAKVRVQLLAADGVTVLATDITDGNGIYGFDGLAPGQYGVRVTPPPGYETSPRDHSPNDALDSDADSAGVIAPTMIFSGDARTNLDAGLFQRVAIGDRVWLDTDRDGIQDPGELGARGTTVRLLDADGDIIATTVTDTNGKYNFRDLLPGTYSVQFMAPIGTVFTLANRGGNDAADSDANLATGVTPQVTLTSGQVNNSLDAGLLIGGSIGDRVWADLDRDGQQDAEEPGIAGATVRLLNRDGTVVVMTTKTDASGYYNFGNLRPAGYIVEFVTPAAHTPTGADIGPDISDSDAGVGGRSGVISVLGGVHVRTVDAGFIPNVVGTCSLPTTLLTPGNDGYTGTAGGDHVDGLGGNDNIHGLAGDDCLLGNDGDDAINGHDGDDKLQGGAGNDILHGNDGNDHVFGGDGNDVIEGGNGNDWIEGGAGDDNMQGEAGDDVVLGGAGNDIVVGNQGNDTVFGGSGNDTVSGHEGNDVIGGGTDNGRVSLVAGKITGLVLGDTVFGDADADRFIYQRGDGVDWLPDFNPINGDTLTIYGHAGFSAVQNINGQTILYLGVNSAIVLNVAYPASSLAGPFPGITFVPGTLVAPEIPAERGAIQGGVGNDSLVGGAGNDLIEGMQGNDTLVGNGGNDTLLGQAGNDWLYGGVGADALDGGTGIDTASYANATGSVVISLSGSGTNAGGFGAGDTLVNIENLVGSNFVDRLTGDGAANRIVGGGGADTILGGGGDDQLVGGVGQDSLIGGLGADRFIWNTLAESAVAAPDVIADFSWAQGDKFDLSLIDANLALGGDQAFLFMGGAAFAGGGQGSIRTTHSGGDTMIEIDQGNGGAAEAVIRLVGLHTLAASDFIL